VYSDEHPEVGIYGQQFRETVEEAGIEVDLDDAALQLDIRKGVCKRLGDMAEGRRRFDKGTGEYDLFRILYYLEDSHVFGEIRGRFPEIEEGRITEIVDSLVFCKYVSGDASGYILTSEGRRLLASLKEK